VEIDVATAGRGARATSSSRAITDESAADHVRGAWPSHARAALAVEYDPLLRIKNSGLIAGHTQPLAARLYDKDGQSYRCIVTDSQLTFHYLQDLPINLSLFSF